MAKKQTAANPWIGAAKVLKGKKPKKDTGDFPFGALAGGGKGKKGKGGASFGS